MSSYTISKKLNPNKVFILQKSEIEKRFDPFFYVPELLELEKIVSKKQPKKLRDYVISVSSGATPKTVELEKYYSDKENGIPFLRVQNLSQTGILQFEECKYINEATHNGMLKRSQVSEGDLLVKITGVGRMAVASVAPKNFVGNINQHVCVIKTNNIETSKFLASFLNSNIGEKLASRRSTGGTRPALDYPALLSIPIIEDKRIVEIANKSVEQKRINEEKAENILASIDTYLLNQLGIVLPEKQENTLKNRMFTISISELSGSRFDPNFNNLNHQTNITSIKNSKYKVENLKQITTQIFQGVGRNIDETSQFKLLKVKNIKRNCEIDYDEIEQIGIFSKDKILQKNDIITPCIGEAIRQIKFAVFEKDSNLYLVDNNVGVIRPNERVNSMYLNYCLCNSIGRLQINRLIGGGGVPFLGSDNLKKFIVPLPPFEKQNEIAEHISEIRKQAQDLKDQTKLLLEKANKEIEDILLNT